MPRYLLHPPNGHAFGFPKLFDGDIDALNIDAWLLEHGYPGEWTKVFPAGEGCRILTLPEIDPTEL